MYNTYIHVHMYMNINELVSWITNYSFAEPCSVLQTLQHPATPCSILQYTAHAADYYTLIIRVPLTRSQIEGQSIFPQKSH